jgi:hypothetical protein
MNAVYRTTNLTDAHVVAGLLEASGVTAVVVDKNLGPYFHALGSVRVAVPPEREAEARKIIADWESRRVPEPPPDAVRRKPLSRDAIVLLVGVAALLAVVWYFGGR